MELNSMEAWNVPVLPALLADYPWAAIAGEMDVVIDVGGGKGQLLCALASKQAQTLPYSHHPH